LSIYDRVPLLADHIKSEARKLFSWTESLNVSLPYVIKGSADQVGSALSIGDPPGWRSALADRDPSSVPCKGGKLPISLLSVNSPARESLVCRTDSQYDLIEEVANSSGSLYRGTDLEQAPYVDNEQVVVQPCFYEAGDEDEEGEKDEGDKGDEEDESGFPNNW
jgi:hypothetical protein